MDHQEYVFWFFFFAGSSLFVQKIRASIFTPVGSRVFAVINCNLKCVKPVHVCVYIYI